MRSETGTTMEILTGFLVLSGTTELNVPYQDVSLITLGMCCFVTWEAGGLKMPQCRYSNFAYIAMVVV